MVDGVMNHRVSDRQLDELRLLFEGETINKVRLRDSLILLQKGHATSLGS